MKRWKWIATGSFLAIASVVGSGWLPESEVVVLAQQGVDSKPQATDCTVALIDIALLASDRPGILDVIDLEEGDAVAADQKVAVLKDGIARAALATATEKASNDVQLRFSKKAAEYADIELDIANETNLRLPGTVPKLEIDKLILGAQKGALSIQQAESEFAVAKLTQAEAEEALKTYEVFASFGGVVTKVHRKKGEAVRQGDPILEVVNTERMKVEGYLSVADSYRVKAGDAVVLSLSKIREGGKEVSSGIEQKTFVGIVKFVEPRIELGNKVKVTAHVQNAEGLLKDGLKGTMTITPNSRSRR